MSKPLLRHLSKPRNWPAALIMSVLWLINLLPYPIKIRIGMAIGSLLYHVTGRRKHIAAVNLALCFPDKDAGEQKALLHRAFRSLGAGLIETAMGWWSPAQQIHRRVTFEGREVLDAAIAQGKGVILVGAHFSTLDLAAKLMSKHFSVHAVYQQQKNELVNHVLEQGRLSALETLIDNRDTRKIVRTIRDGNVVWFAPDHDMGKRVSVFAPFFGHQAATVTATSKFAKLTGAPVVFCANHRNETNTGYQVRLSALPENFSTLDDLSAATLVNQTITRHILLDPAQYYWFHRKFKTQPGLDKAELYR